MIDTHQTLGEIATQHPESTFVFMRHRLDFCCGGRKDFGEACKTAGLDPEGIAAEIEAEGARRTAQRWDGTPLPELIDFILERYHAPLRADLPVLIGAAHKVERVHVEEPGCPRGLALALEELDEELQLHLAKEEQMLFPAIRAGSRGAPIHMPIRVIMQEHDDHGERLRQLRELATDLSPPADACATWRALYAGLERLEAELMEHIHLENNILFPRALTA
jgi:regulator of cell morphogenesis and NO signaling